MNLGMSHSLMIEDHTTWGISSCSKQSEQVYLDRLLPNFKFDAT